MRYILLFVLAILLPVFAFLNFTQSEDGIFLNSHKITDLPKKIIGGETIQKYTDKIASGIFTEKEIKKPAVEEKKTAALSETAKSSAWVNDDTPLNVEAKSSDRKYEIPKLDYTEPVKFPLTETLSQPYLEGFKTPSFFPIRDWSVKIEDIGAISALAIEPFTQKVLYHKNIFDPRPIASLTKLMTALVVIDEMDLKSVVRISEYAVSTYGEQGDLALDERITVENLLYALLISSSNDAALALEEYYNAFRTESDKTFVAAMNRKAQGLNLMDTFFVEPSGLNINNRSTAYDLARLADYVFQRPILRQIMSTQTIDTQSVDGIINHHLVNSNKLLGVMDGILAGKTGFTEEAGESIVLFVKKNKNIDDYLIYIILGSDDRIKSARQLINWVKTAYIWE